MKKINQILSHILNPYDKKIETYRCLRKIISLLPKKYNKYISSTTLKGETLYINVTHQALKTEIFYNRKLIFDIIKMLHSQNQCLDINPAKIVTFYKYKKPTKPQTKIIKKPTAKGEFKIKSNNEEIKKIFEEIKKELKSQ